MLRTPRTYHHADFPADRLAVERDATVSVVVPARECSATIATVVRALLGLVEAGAADEVVVIDAASQDGTAALARGEGAQVVLEGSLLPELGPVLGKGDAMWRALAATTGDVVAYVDGDTEDFGPRFAAGVLGPVVCGLGAELAKGDFRRPFRAGETVLPEGGGRVTELTAKPLLRRFWPELAAFGQPLAGEIAARRSLLEAIPFCTGYGGDFGMLIDAYERVGLRRLAQVDLDVRHNPHQPLDALGRMADDVLDAALRRAGVERGTGEADRVVERPPMASVRAAAA